MRRRERTGLMASCQSSVKSERPHGVRQRKKEKTEGGEKNKTCDGCRQHDVTRMQKCGTANPSICLEDQLGRGRDGNEEVREGRGRRCGRATSYTAGQTVKDKKIKKYRPAQRKSRSQCAGRPHGSPRNGEGWRPIGGIQDHLIRIDGRGGGVTERSRSGSRRS